LIYIKVFQKTVAASQLDDLIGSIIVPDGYVITILELGFTLPADSLIYGYVGEVKTDEIHGSYAATIHDRIIVNRELVAGQEFKLTSTSITGGATAILCVYDKSKR